MLELLFCFQEGGIAAHRGIRTTETKLEGVNLDRHDGGLEGYRQENGSCSRRNRLEEVEGSRSKKAVRVRLEKRCWPNNGNTRYFSR